MKNILGEKPIRELKGRLLTSVEFVADADIKEKTVLNIGCGYGWCELNFLDRDVKEITGIEITEEGLETARKNIVSDRTNFQVASAINLPFEDASFDTVVCWEVIEHIPIHTETLMFTEVNRVLKNGGTFYLSTPFNSFFSNILDPAWWLIGHRHYSKQQLIQYGLKHGFEVSDLNVRGGSWVLLSILNMYFSKWILRRKSLFGDFFLKKEDAEYQKAGFVNIFVKYRKP